MKKSRSNQSPAPRLPVPKVWYSVEEVAARYHRTPAVIRQWLRTGFLGGKRIGGKWMISDVDLAAFEARF